MSGNSEPQGVAYLRRLCQRGELRSGGAERGRAPAAGRGGAGLRRRGGAGRSGFPAPGRCRASGPRYLPAPGRPPAVQVAAMSSGASVSALQRLVEQLKLEASVERIKVRPSPAPGLGAWKPPAPAPPRHLWAGEEEAAPEPGAAGPARWRASPQGPRSSGGTGEPPRGRCFRFGLVGSGAARWRLEPRRP